MYSDFLLLFFVVLVVEAAVAGDLQTQIKLHFDFKNLFTYTF